MKRNKSTEDYLECILLLSNETEFVHRVDVARRMKVSQPAVQKAVKILTDSQFVECDGLHIYLTAEGRKYAERVYDRHVTIRGFLERLGVNGQDADADACEMEHVISAETFRAIKNFMKGN